MLAIRSDESRFGETACAATALVDTCSLPPSQPRTVSRRPAPSMAFQQLLRRRVEVREELARPNEEAHDLRLPKRSSMAIMILCNTLLQVRALACLMAYRKLIRPEGVLFQYHLILRTVRRAPRR
jgi:hypothetical protein